MHFKKSTMAKKEGKGKGKPKGKMTGKMDKAKNGKPKPGSSEGKMGGYLGN